MEKDGTFDLLPKKEVIGLKKEYEKLNKMRETMQMTKNKKIMIPLVIVFSFTELVLFFFVQLTTGKEWEAVAYASVVLACVFMLASFSKTKNYICYAILPFFNLPL